MNKKEVEHILNSFNISVKKKFGQNFLLDQNILNKIVTTLSKDDMKNVIEIGPGLGFLTKEITKISNKTVLYEIDDEMVNYLEKQNFPNTTICNIDVLKINVKNEVEEKFGGEFVSLVANLPYYITTAILTKFLTESPNVNKMVVMMQKEVAQRICGKPKTKDYNALSVFIQYYSNATIAINVPANSFYPAPEVESSVVLIERKEIKNKALNEIAFNNFVKDIFAQRRKTLMNNISKTNYSKDIVKEVLQKQGYSLSVRSEELSVNQIVDLFNAIYSY
jgi:16S rRNA (adenine1518-N6/adenine1519-N6)-dimethyltransferase